MEIREFAERVLSADTMEEKLLDPGPLTDREPGAPLLLKEPSRPPGMHFQHRGRGNKIPSFQEHHDPDKRAVCLHRFAGHELLAVEIMAYALLAFPDAPAAFRKGVVNTLKEEQEHVRLYTTEVERLGLHFGDLPLYRHFWVHVPYLTDPINYIATVSLTFETANLDFASMYGASFLRVGDNSAARVMDRILKDEIGHVNFGWHWLKRFKEKKDSEWKAWTEAQSPLLSPKRSKGFILQEEHRLRAGIPQEWIDTLKEHL